MQIKAREITGAWPEWARKVRDAWRVRHIVDGGRMVELLTEGMSPAAAFHGAVSAMIWTDVTKGGTVRAVCLWFPRDVASRVFCGTAGGYGYDKATSAMAGFPVGQVGDEVVCLTDHCGLNQEDGLPAWLSGFREVTLDRLPAGLFLV